MGELVDIERDGAVARVVMHRNKINAIAEDLMAELGAAFKEVGADSSVRAVVLASAYEKYFSVGADLAAIIPLEHLELVREILARQEVEKQAAQIPWERAPKTLRPPQEWFDETDNPFEPEEGTAP